MALNQLQQLIRSKVPIGIPVIIRIQMQNVMKAFANNDCKIRSVLIVLLLIMTPCLGSLLSAQCEFNVESDGERAYFFSLETDWQTDSSKPEWFVNGVSKSKAPNFSYVFFAAGDYEVCIVIEESYCELDECINLSFSTDWFDDPSNLELNSNFRFTGSHLIVENPNADAVDYRWGLESSIQGSVNVGVSLGYGIFLTEEICGDRTISIIMVFTVGEEEQMLTYDFMVHRVCSCNSYYSSGSSDNYLSNFYFEHNEDPALGNYYWWLIDEESNDTTVLTESSYDLTLDLGEYTICLNRYEQYCASTVCKNVDIDCGADFFYEMIYSSNGEPPSILVYPYAGNDEIDFELEWIVNGDSMGNYEPFIVFDSGFDTTIVEVCLSAVSEECSELECEYFQQYCPIEIFDSYEDGKFTFTHSNESSDSHYWTINNQYSGKDDTLVIEYDDTSSLTVCVHYDSENCSYYDCYYVNTECSVNLFETWAAHVDLNGPAYPGTYKWIINGDTTATLEMDEIQQYQETGYGYFYHIDLDCGLFEVCVSFVSDDSSFFTPCEDIACLVIDNRSELYESWQYTNLSTSEALSFELTSSVEQNYFAIAEWQLSPSDGTAGVWESYPLDDGNTMVWEPDFEWNPEIDYEMCLYIYSEAPSGPYCEEIFCQTIEGECPPCALCDPGASENPDCLCENFTVQYQIECFENSYDIIFSFITNTSGLALINQETGATIELPPTGTHTVIQQQLYTGFSYAVVSNDDPKCNFIATNTLVDCASVNIELVNFSGEIRQKNNHLYWSTASEKNCAAFILERSENGSDFYQITEISCAGESNTTQAYHFDDQEYREKISFYRLKERNSDGRVQIVSKVIAIERDDFSVISLYPNPATELVSVDLSTIESQEKTDLWMVIYDLKGEVVQQYSDFNSSYEFPYVLSLRGLSPGMYYLQINSTKMQEHLRFIKN